MTPKKRDSLRACAHATAEHVIKELADKKSWRIEQEWGARRTVVSSWPEDFERDVMPELLDWVAFEGLCFGCPEHDDCVQAKDDLSFTVNELREAGEESFEAAVEQDEDDFSYQKELDYLRSRVP